MNRRVIMLMVALVALCGVVGWLLRPVAVVPLPATTAQYPAAPDFTYRGFDGGEHRLLDLAGRSVVLHFWASWCAPCRLEFPALVAAARELGDAVIVLAISTDTERAKAEKFLRDVGADHPPENLRFAFDPQQKIAYDVFMTAVYPESIVLDAQLRMRRKIPGPADWAAPELRQQLRDFAAPQPGR
jgi:thiol-disulfide isomerase/thioredoxin